MQVSLHINIVLLQIVFSVITPFADMDDIIKKILNTFVFGKVTHI